MKAIGFSIEDCRNALESYAAEIDELMALVNDAATMTPAKVEEARTQLSNLKSCLKQDYKRRDTNDGRAKMTEVEAAIFAPAVHQAFADLHVPVNSRPSEQWFSELYGIQINIHHALDSLTRWNK